MFIRIYYRYDMFLLQELELVTRGLLYIQWSCYMYTENSLLSVFPLDLQGPFGRSPFSHLSYFFLFFFLQDGKTNIRFYNMWRWKAVYIFIYSMLKFDRWIEYRTMNYSLFFGIIHNTFPCCERNSLSFLSDEFHLMSGSW